MSDQPYSSFILGLRCPHCGGIDAVGEFLVYDDATVECPDCGEVCCMPEGGDIPRPTVDDYRAAAWRLHVSDGELEIDDGAPVSMGDDPGAYVQAWVWVPDEQASRDTGHA